MRDVVITGMGAVTPLGSNPAAFGQRMFAGESGIVDIRLLRVAPNFPVCSGALVPEDAPLLPDALRDSDAATMPPAIRYAAVAAQQAIDDSGPGHPIDAIVFATAIGVDFHVIREYSLGAAQHLCWDTTRSESCLGILRMVAQDRGCGNVPETAAINIYNACVSSSQAIGMAMNRIRSGEWTRVLVGGSDARCNDATLMDFHLLNALSTDTGPRASRPFSKDRNGFVFGEGAAALILESRRAARDRSARVFGKVSGYASTSDGYRLTDGRPDAAAATHAIRNAVADAGLSPWDIDAISAHGTSTPLNDRLETKAIKQALGGRAYQVPVSALKSQIGHTTVASAAIQAVASLLMFEHGRLGPTMNYEEPDPECDLDYVPNHSRAAEVRTILSNSFGFGGQNSCLVFERAD